MNGFLDGRRGHTEDVAQTIVNVPLMWSAGCGDRDCGVLQWLATAAASLSESFLGDLIDGAAAACAGWEDLSGAIRERERTRRSRLTARSSSMGISLQRKDPGAHPQQGSPV